MPFHVISISFNTLIDRIGHTCLARAIAGFKGNFRTKMHLRQAAKERRVDFGVVVMQTTYCQASGTGKFDWEIDMRMEIETPVPGE